MQKHFRALIALVAIALATHSLAAEDDWNLSATARVTEAIAAAERGELAAVRRALDRLEEEAAAATALSERASAGAHADRVRLALARAHVRGGSFEQALPLLKAIALEGKSAAVQKEICAARLDALMPLLLKADGRIVVPWMPIANDRFGPQQPNASLRALYTKVDRRDAAEQVGAALAAWERLDLAGWKPEPKDAGKMPAPQALDKTTVALVRYAWGLANRSDTERLLAALPPAESRAASLRFARLLLDERDLPRAIPRLLEIERIEKKDALADEAAEELLRIQAAYERLRVSVPILTPPNVAAEVKPYLTDPAWKARREKILRDFDAAVGALDLSVVLGNSSLEEVKYFASGLPKADDDGKDSTVEVPPDIIAKAELGDHFETINLDRPDIANPFRKEPEAGGKANRYRSLGLLGGVLHMLDLEKADMKKIAARDVREEFELQIDHQEYLIEPLGSPLPGSDKTKGLRPLLPSSPLKLTVVSRYHGTLELEARRLPEVAGYTALDARIKPEQIEALPVVKSYTLELGALADNLNADPTKATLEVAEHGLTPGYYVLTARARYCPVLALTRIAVGDTRLIARHAPGGVLLWSLDRQTGAPRAGAKLGGSIKLVYSGETAWGDAPLPIEMPKQTARRPMQKIPPEIEERRAFITGFEDAINGRAYDAGGEFYTAGAAEGKKRFAQFPPHSLPLPAATDASGLARVDFPAEWLGHRCVIAAKVDGCDVDALALDYALSKGKQERVIEWVADRPVVRPGQSVRLRAFVRENRNGRMTPAAGGLAPLRIDLNGTLLFDSTVPVDANGACVFEQLIDPDAHDGVISVLGWNRDGADGKSPGTDYVYRSAKNAKALCSVSGGTPAPRRLRIELPPHPLPAGTRVRGKVFVESAAGVPLAGVPIQLATRLERFEPSSKYALPFGTVLQGYFEGDGILPGTMVETDLVSDADGAASFELELPNGRNVIARVDATSGGGVRSTAHATCAALGLTAKCVWRVESFEQASAGKPARLRVEARTLTGEPYTKQLDVSNDKGFVLASFTPGNDGYGTADVQTTASTNLRLRPTNSDDAGFLSLPPPNAPAASDEKLGRVVAARLDKRSYRVGETAILTLRANRPNLTVLFCTESSGITRSEVVTIATRTKQIEIPLTEQDAPNTTIALTALADDLVDCVLLPLEIAQSERELAVKLSADATESAPGKTVQLTVAATDAHGKPAANADVVLAVYDRQLLMLASDPAPRFGEAFWANSLVPHETAWTTGAHTFTYGSGFLWQTPEWSFGPYAMTSTALYNDIGIGRGSFGSRNGGGRKLMVKRHGGGLSHGENNYTRERFDEQALWLVNLKTGADGTVTAPLKVPDALTTLRAVAYVLTPRADAGSAQLDLPVRRDIELALEAPRELRLGDRAEMSLSVHNHSNSKQRVSLRSTFPMDVLSTRLVLNDGSTAELPNELELEPHASATVRYVLDAAKPHIGKLEPDRFLTADWTQWLFEVQATAPGGAVLDHAIFQVVLNQGGRPEREVTHVIGKNGTKIQVGDGGSFDPWKTTLTVTLRRGFKGMALDARELQFVFPEHCLEQTLSRFVPAVALADALGDEETTPAERARLEGVLSSGVTRLRTLAGQSELHPLIAWYGRRLAGLPAGRAALHGDSDWKNAARSCEQELATILADKNNTEPFKFIAENDATPIMFGAFRRELWLAYGAAQGAHTQAANPDVRKVRERFEPLCAEAVQRAREHKLAPHDRALAGLLCATVGRKKEAEELLMLANSDVFAAPSANTAHAAMTAQSMRVLTGSLDVMSAVELKKSEPEIFALALRLEGLVDTRVNGFGTTFLNGVGVMALADAIKACGATTRSTPGPITLKVGGSVVAELPANVALKRVTLDPNTVEKLHGQGGLPGAPAWTFEIAAPDGQSVGVAIERRTRVPERVEVLPRAELDKRVAAMSAPAPESFKTQSGIEVRRALFVREPSKDHAEHAPLTRWRPYAGQPLPRGTELLALTEVVRAPGVQCVQVELPLLPGWDAAAWNNIYHTENSVWDMQFHARAPGMLDSRTVAPLLGKVAPQESAAQILRLVREQQWADVAGSISISVQAMPGGLVERGARLIYSPFTAFNVHNLTEAKRTSAETSASIQYFAISGQLRAAGKFALPGARAWAWYDPAIDVTGPSDRVEVTDDKNASLAPPESGVAQQAWLEKAWAELAKQEWTYEPPEAGSPNEPVNAVTLAAQALTRCPGNAAPVLVAEWLASQSRGKGFAALRERHARLAEIQKALNLQGARGEIAQLIVAPHASFDALKRDAAAAGVAGTQPPPLPQLLEWIKDEQASARSLLTLLPPGERAKALAMDRVTVREFLALWFDSDAKAREWLWAQPAAAFDTTDWDMDSWAKRLREKFGLDIRVDPRAPLVALLPAAPERATLREYIANALAEGEVAAGGIEAGEHVVLHRIGATPEADPKPLDARAALELDVFGLTQAKCLHANIREELWLRGIQFVAADGLETFKGRMPLRQYVEWCEKVKGRPARIEKDVIELK